MNPPEGTSITPFLLFTGEAEEAMSFYVSLFADSAIEEITRYGADGPGAEGSVQAATFSLHGQKIMCTDSTAELDFTFNPAISLFVSCLTEEELEKYAEALSKDGKVLMPPDNYGFSKKFTGSKTASESPGS